MGALRPVTKAVAALAAILMVIAVNPWFPVDKAYKDVIAYAFWISSIVMIVLIFIDSRSGTSADEIEIEGPAIHPVPVLQLAGRPVLAADPAVPWLRLDRRGLAQVHRHRLDRRRHRAPGLLDHAVAVPEHGQPGDHLRLVPDLPRSPCSTTMPTAGSRYADHVRRDSGRRGPHHRRPDRLRRVLRLPHEHVLHARRARRPRTR